MSPQPYTRAGAANEPQPWPEHTAGSDAAEAHAVACVALRLQHQRHAQALTAAHTDGFWQGERKGYLQGWGWGVICGAAAGVLVTVLLMMLAVWQHGDAPTAELLQQLRAAYPDEGQT